MARPTGRALRTELIHEASAAIQDRGTSFSFNQLAERLGVRAPSLHHHFRTKGDLIAAATDQYIADFEAAVAEIAIDGPADRLHSYVDVFTAPARAGRFCLCGALTADWIDTSDSTRQAIVGFFDQQRGWIETATLEAIAAGELRSEVDAPMFAEALLAALEGSLLLARACPSADVGAAAIQLIELARV